MKRDERKPKDTEQPLTNPINREEPADEEQLEAISSWRDTFRRLRKKIVLLWPA